MCGIAGWVDYGKNLLEEREHAQATTKRMADTLACRGPDAEGFWRSEHCTFAHRRLAVIDIEGGKQPMVRARVATGAATPALRGDFVVTYAGEIYNFQELRKELAALDHPFETRSDTEVLLRAYMQWGAAAVERLNGMFAFGVWDASRQELFLARDRLGVKPLFYAVRGDMLVFGSEPKALLAHPQVHAEVDAEGLAEILVVGPARTPGHGVYRGMHELRPGHVLRFDRAHGAKVTRYWQLPSRRHEDDLAKTKGTLRALLEDVVRRQLVSDVPICTLLSGGLDSSAVTALGARIFQDEKRGQLATYSVELKDAAKFFVASPIHPDLDGPWAQKLAKELGVLHRDVILDTQDLVDHIDAPLRARDLPSLGELDVSLYLLCREIKKTHTVAVSGESADEVFGGYPWFHDPRAIEADDYPWDAMMRRPASLLAPDLVRRMRPSEYTRARYLEAIAEVPPPATPEQAAPREKRMREILYLNQTRFLNMLLDRKDRMSMAVGLEVRVPFCDHRLVEYAWNIPWGMKTARGCEKGLLREALTGVLPEDLLWRKKSAYPSMLNPVYAQAMRSKLEAVLADPNSPLLALIDVPAVRASLDAPVLGPGGPLMSPATMWAHLGQIDRWLREYRVKLV
jgi:asparagine synthase (glutamine-hydrolysing)